MNARIWFLSVASCSGVKFPIAAAAPFWAEEVALDDWGMEDGILWAPPTAATPSRVPAEPILPLVEPFRPICTRIISDRFLGEQKEQGNQNYLQYRSHFQRQCHSAAATVVAVVAVVVACVAPVAVVDVAAFDTLAVAGPLRAGCVP